ncbi:MAG: GntR family transcriptional regulator [Saprospiraceae bacterium]|nr:GntR family transcriptional regulator [Saprospiraceae bacterium]MCB9320426.1 GntR family transcriptional regulator [Lewinellaceae bacterium]
MRKIQPETFLEINEYSKTPKYRQIINSVIRGIEQGLLQRNDRLPSVNQLLIAFDISRDTVVKAYDYLKEKEIIDAVPGKGYYIKSVQMHRQHNVFLLFNKLSAHKKIIYDSFSETLGDQAAIDFFIYNNNYRLFKQLIRGHLNRPYTHFVIIAHFLDGGDDLLEVLEGIPREKLIVLDKLIPGISGDYAAVYQDFRNDIYSALTQALHLLKKYRKLKIIFPPDGYHPQEIITGFRSFCQKYGFETTIVSSIADETLEQKDAYITLMEDDLVQLIKKIKSLGWKVGDDVGILSYNETPLKEILLDGITVMSTDFHQLGATAANLILNGKKEHVINPFSLVVRHSL